MVFENPVARMLANLRDDMTRVFFSAVVYVAIMSLGVGVFVAVPIGEVRILVLLGIVIIAALSTRVTLPNSRAIADSGDLSKELAEVRNALRVNKEENDYKDKDIARLRYDLQHTEVTTTGKLDFLMEMNIAEIDTIHRRVIDYLIHPKVVGGRPKAEVWPEDPEFDAENGSARVVGVYKYPYKAKLGIDLREVRAVISENGKALRYCLPEPVITGVLLGGEVPEWEYQIALRNEERVIDIRPSADKKKLFSSKPLYRKDRWVYEDESRSPKSYDIWSEVKDEVHRSIQSGGSIGPELNQIADQLSEKLFEGMVRSFWGLEPVRVQLDEIDNPRRLADLINDHSQVKRLYGGEG